MPVLYDALGVLEAICVDDGQAGCIVLGAVDALSAALPTFPKQQINAKRMSRADEIASTDGVPSSIPACT